ncbi:unnamed protein product [Cylindrotheca closterium]|uniref:Uncharacterized protein n=1 Tax=Cylindrotheca closterium TaxID=2856 RepID=A0AAD2G3W1_9STRA|nr:unnamed protein product [Cylindrotheca closterium]
MENKELNHDSLPDTQGSLTEPRNLRLEQRQMAESMSSVDYFSCCGLGHRLSKMSDAHYVAKKRLNFQLRVFWATCALSPEHDDDGKEITGSSAIVQQNQTNNVEVFHFFFGPQPFSELQELQRQQAFAEAYGNYTHSNLRLNNEIPGFKKFKRQSEEFYYVPPIPVQQRSSTNDLVNTASMPPPNRTTSQELCPYHHGLEDFFQETADFHQSLKDRFVSRHQTLIDYWRDTFQFANHTVFGLHVRAGNGEKGDFLRKNRGLEDWDTWAFSVSELIAQMIRQEEWTKTSRPPLLFLAIDTDSILHKLQEHLQGILPLVSLPQEREADGLGVAFGNTIRVHKEKCLEKWRSSILDMMLLSDADVIVAGRPSSFTQSLPMSIALSRNHTNNDDSNIKSHPYCEVNRNATLYNCYSDFEDWCCNGKSSFHMEGIHPGYEYRRLPLALDQEDFSTKIQPRTTSGINALTTAVDPLLVRQRSPLGRRTPLPYDWTPMST